MMICPICKSNEFDEFVIGYDLDSTPQKISMCLQCECRIPEMLYSENQKGTTRELGVVCMSRKISTLEGGGQLGIGSCSLLLIMLFWPMGFIPVISNHGMMVSGSLIVAWLLGLATFFIVVMRDKKIDFMESLNEYDKQFLTNLDALDNQLLNHLAKVVDADMDVIERIRKCHISTGIN